MVAVSYACPVCGWVSAPQPIRATSFSHRCPKKAQKQVVCKEVDPTAKDDDAKV